MVTFIKNDIEKKAKVSLADGQEQYRKYFINTNLYLNFKAGVDDALTKDGYADCIVTA
jgi:hypothetical protein